ncbi:MAG: PAC2 family protein [Candidatus Eremiobacterota bacterium]
MIKYHINPDFHASVMLAGWPGMGAVATQSVDYIRRKLDFELFAEIEIDDLTLVNSVVVVQGIGSFPKLPGVYFFYSKDYDFIICEAEDQFSGQIALKVMEDLFILTDIIGVNTIYTGAAFVRHMNYREDSKIYVVANRTGLRDRLLEQDINILTQGQVAGINGSILGFSSLKDIEAACFLATIPIYSINFPNPKASMAITKLWQKLLGFQIDFVEYEYAVKKSDETFAVLEEHLKKMTMGEHEGTHEDDLKVPEDDLKEPEDELKITENKHVIPHTVIQDIEELFKQAQTDRALAHKLKEELDRWNLFNEYEDRFLDLFRNSQ